MGRGVCLMEVGGFISSDITGSKVLATQFKYEIPGEESSWYFVGAKERKDPWE